MMIPNTEDYLLNDFDIEEVPSMDFKMHIEEDIINGYTDGLNAIEQAIYVILNTERYKYPIYPLSYGIELDDLYGELTSYVCPELKRRIEEALLQDDRIIEVNNFEFDLSKKNTVQATFTVETIYGDVEVEKVVNI